jgi:hypothetical protein
MNPIFVLVFWILPIDNGAHFKVDSVELSGIAPTSERCASVTRAELASTVPDFAAKVVAGLQPEVVCGMAAPPLEENSQESAPAAPKEYVPDHPVPPSWKDPGTKTQL